MPHGLAGDVEEALDAQHVVLRQNGAQAVFQVARITDRAEIGDEADELVVAVLAFLGVVVRPALVN